MYVDLLTNMQAGRKRELLKPPEIKPVCTLMLMFFCMCYVGDPANVDYNKWAKAQADNAAAGLPTGTPPPTHTNWCIEHSITAEKFFRAFSGQVTQTAPPPPPPPPKSGGKGKDQQASSEPPKPNPLFSFPIVALTMTTLNATAAQLSPLIFVVNGAFWWIFGTVVEKKLLSWRYPLFLLIGLISSWWLVAHELQYIAPTQRFIGPVPMFMYLIGAYLVFKPKKPFKPQDWKPIPWKVFNADDSSQEKRFKMPFVSPWVYISLFAVYTGLVYGLTAYSGKDIAELTHVPFAAAIRQALVGSLAPGMFQILRPLPGLEACLAGMVSAYVLLNVVFKPRLRREAGDLQVQAILQYKELRALDMNHKQAVEGTSKLLGVPLDIVKDWISKGLQTPPPDDH